MPKTKPRKVPGALVIDLLRAAMSNDVEKIKNALDAGAPVDGMDEHFEYTALGHAIKYGGEAAALLLLDRGANPNARFGDANESRGELRVIDLVQKKTLSNQNGNMSVAVLEKMLEKGLDLGPAKDGATPAIFNLMFSHVLRPRLLRELPRFKDQVHIADTMISETHPFVIALNNDSEASIEIMLQNGFDPNYLTTAGDRPLHIATQELRGAVMKLLLRYGADINGQDIHGNTVAHLQATRDRLGVVEDLIQRGADPSLRNDDGLNVAAVAGAKTREWLIGQGYSPNYKDIPWNTIRKMVGDALDNDRAETLEDLVKTLGPVTLNRFFVRRERDTLLAKAARANAQESIKMLVRHGADINEKSPGGFTPVLIAAHGRQFGAAALLLHLGADHRIKGLDGEGLHDIAKNTRPEQPEFIGLLRSLDARTMLKNIEASCRPPASPGVA